MLINLVAQFEKLPVIGQAIVSIWAWLSVVNLHKFLLATKEKVKSLYSKVVLFVKGLLKKKVA